MRHGYFLVDPGLGLPAIGLDADAQTRILSFLMKRIDVLASVPAGLQFELIPAQYLGGTYLAIGFYDVDSGMSYEGLMSLMFDLCDQLKAYVDQEGVESLREAASGETVRWQDVLNRFGIDAV